MSELEPVYGPFDLFVEASRVPALIAEGCLEFLYESRDLRKMACGWRSLAADDFVRLWKQGRLSRTLAREIIA